MSPQVTNHISTHDGEFVQIGWRVGTYFAKATTRRPVLDIDSAKGKDPALLHMCNGCTFLRVSSRVTCHCCSGGSLHLSWHHTVRSNGLRLVHAHDAWGQPKPLLL